MNRQQKCSRSKQSRPSSSGTVNPYRRKGTKKGSCNRDADDGLRLDQPSKKLGRGEPKKQSKPPRKSIGKKKWNDGFSSDDDRSSSDDSTPSDCSAEEARKITNNKSASTQFNVTQPKKRERKVKINIISRSSLSRVHSAGVREQTTPYNAPRREIVKLAETKANEAITAEDITSVSQLQWYRIKLFQTEERTRERLQPCRVLSPGEAFKQKRKMKGMERGSSDEKKMIQYLTFPDVDKGIYKLVEESSLIPFGYRSRDGLSTTFNDDYLERYMNQERNTTSSRDLQATRLFLKNVFDHARETQTKSREQSNRDLQDYYDDNCVADANSNACSSFEVSDGKRVQFEVLENAGDADEESNHEIEDLDVPYTQAITFDPDDLGPVREQSNEPIRPGDVIEYYSPIFVAGDARGLRQTAVLSVTPNKETALVLSNGEVLPNNTKVKRTKVISGNELLDHPGIYRPIYRFKLATGGSATAADAIMMEASRFGKTMHNNMNKMKAKAQAEGFAPMDLLVNIKGANAGASAKSLHKSKSPAITRSHKMQLERLSSEDSSGGDDEIASEKLKQQARKKTTGMNTGSVKVSDNKENNDMVFGRAESMSCGSLSSSASSGLPLAPSDDSSIESLALSSLGKNRTKIMQREKSSSKGKRAALKSQCRAVYDLCHYDVSDSSTSRSRPIKNTGNVECKTPSKSFSPTALSSPDVTVNSESSLETPNSSGLRNKPTYKKSPSSHLVGSSKRRLDLGTTSKIRVCDINNNGKGSTSKSPSCRKLVIPSLPSHSSSEHTSFPTSRRPTKKKKPAPTRKMEKVLPKSSFSPDSVEIEGGNKSKRMAKTKTLSPSLDSLSIHDSDEDIHLPRKKGSKRHVLCEQLSDFSVSIGSQTESKNEKEPARELLLDNHDAVNSLGWAQGMAGWKKSGSAALSIKRIKK